MLGNRGVGLDGARERAHSIVAGCHDTAGGRAPADRTQPVCTPPDRDAAECNHTNRRAPEAEAEEPSRDRAAGEWREREAADRNERAHRDVAERDPTDG